ncbi:MAG: hypothetical protein HYZ74_02610 [Elusimicrobia bacterium]|nr:hypothetical protein [Elusimicrobiota bacterium]
MRPALLAVLLALAPAAPAAEPSGNLLGGSLVEALAAIQKPELSGVFTYVGEKNTPRAFADLIARDPKAMKRYLEKIKNDMKVAEGATAWDHEVCATLVTYYNGPAIAGLKRPDAKRMKILNAGVLAPVKELQEIVSRRGR